MVSFDFLKVCLAAGLCAVCGQALAVPTAVAEPAAVDFTGAGIPIKRLNGVCNSIPLKGNRHVDSTNKFTQLIRALEISETRFHDVVSENPGIELVDVSRIFPLFHADENDPKNYNFRPTDLYLACAREIGGELEFRFGEMIEHQAEQFQVQPPADIAKWARICINIARHYNDGWANGYHWNLRRFSVWEEPDNNQLLTGSSKGNYEKCYFRMYAEVARGIKRLWPDAEVGGPNTMGAGDRFEQFVMYCASEKLPLDFAAFTSYCRETDQLFSNVRHAREFLDKHGFNRTEVEVSEWHYAPVDWSVPTGEFDRYVEDLTGTDAAAYHCAVLTRAEVEPVDHLFYYAMLVWKWGIFDADRHPLPTYYGFRDFATVTHDAVRVPGPVLPALGWYALATRRKDGTKHLLLTAFRAQGELRLPVKGAAFKRATMVARHGEQIPFADFSFSDGELRVPCPAWDAVYVFDE